MYSNAIHNHKLMRLAPSDRWYYVAILCMKSEGELDEATQDEIDEIISTNLRLTDKEWRVTKERLQKVKLVDENCQPVGWKEHQYQNDVSTERVRKFRELQKKKKGETLPKRFSNVSETDLKPPQITDTDTDTDTEDNTTPTSPSSDSLRESSEESVVVGKTSVSPPCPYQKIIDSFNKICSPGLPAVQKLTPARRSAIQARWRDGLNDMREWQAFFEYVESNDFLMGRKNGTADRPAFRASFDWILKPSNYVKIYEGNYDG